MHLIHEIPTNFDEFVKRELEEFAPINSDRQEVLKDYGLDLIANKYPSMKRAAEGSDGKFNIKNVVQSLKDLKHCDCVFKEQRMALFRSLDKRQNIYLGGDDMTVEKVGTKAHGVGKLYDHTKKKVMKGWLIVDLSIKHGGEVYGALFVLKTPTTMKKYLKGSNSSSAEIVQYQQNNLLKRILKGLIKELRQAGFKKKRVWVSVDRWFPSESFFRFLRDQKVMFVVAVKKNTVVVLPDKKKWWKAQRRKRGRKPKNFLRTLSIEKFFQQYRKSTFFEIDGQSDPIEAKEAQINLNIVSQVKIFAYFFPNATSWRYFVAPKTVSSPQKAYQHYKNRWPVETIHQELKDIFGLGKGKMRRDDVVEGHLTLVYMFHQFYLRFKLFLKKRFNFILTAKKLHDHVRSFVPPIPDPLLVLGS